MSKKDYSKPYSHPRWNDTGLPKVIGEVPSTFERQKEWLDAIKEGDLIDDKEYNKRLKELKEKYSIKD
jgi:hypothetical protein